MFGFAAIESALDEIRDKTLLLTWGKRFFRYRAKIQLNALSCYGFFLVVRLSHR